MRWKIFSGRHDQDQPKPGLSLVKDEPALDADEVLSRCFASDGSAVRLRNLFGDVEIVSGAERISLKACGKRSRLEQLRVETREGAFSVKDKPLDTVAVNVAIDGSRSRTMVRHSDGSVTITRSSSWFRFFRKTVGEVFNIAVLTEADRIQFTLHVPDLTGLDVQGVRGKVTGASAILGAAILKPAYARPVVLGEVQNLSVDSASNSSVTVGTVRGGSLELTAGYQATVEVREGTVSNLNLTTGSNATVIFGGKAARGEINAGYSAKVTVASISDQVGITTGSNAKVNVKAGSARLLTINAGYAAHVWYSGKAARADVTTNSNAGVTVKSAERLKAGIGYAASLVCHDTINEANLTTGSNATCELGATAALVANLGYNTRLVVGGNIERINLVTGSNSETDVKGTVGSGDIEPGYNSIVRANAYGRSVARRGRQGEVTTLR